MYDTQVDIMWLISLSCALRVCNEVTDDNDNDGGHRANNIVNTTQAEW